jgi:DDE superfamily endonuclease
MRTTGSVSAVPPRGRGSSRSILARESPRARLRARWASRRRTPRTLRLVEPSGSVPGYVKEAGGAWRSDGRAPDERLRDRAEAGERDELERRAREVTAPWRDVQRARMILYAAEGMADIEIAARLDCHPDTVGTDDDGSVPSVWAGCRTRRGRVDRAVFPPEQVAEVVALACELPARHERPLGRFSRAELHQLVIEQGVTEASATTIWRWLHDRWLKPLQQRSWIFPRDRDFQPKAGRVLDLYARRFEGRRLHPGEYVICADEKSQLQALARRHRTVPAAPGRAGLVEFEYRRGGTLAYLAARDVHHARLFGRCEERTGIESFGRLVEQVMSSEPYASAKRVFWIVDNGSSHAGQRSIDRLRDAYANARLIHPPIHASWLNQIEIYVSILQRTALTPNEFADLDAVAARIAAFEDHYRQIAQPFEWTFTRAKLDALLARLATREPQLCLAA